MSNERGETALGQRRFHSGEDGGEDGVREIRRQRSDKAGTPRTRKPAWRRPLPKHGSRAAA